MKVFTLFLLILVCSYAYPQSGTAIYKKEYTGDYAGSSRGLKLKKADPQRFALYKNIEEKRRKYTKILEYELVFSGSKSLFTMKEVMDIADENNIKLAAGPNTGIYYHNATENNTIFNVESLNQTFNVELKPVHWKLINEEKIINGYKCRKAIGERIVYDKQLKEKLIPIEAWYSLDISINYAPNGFAGLPGLIVSVEERDEKFILESFKLHKKDKNIERPKGEEITLKELYQKIHRALNGIKS